MSDSGDSRRFPTTTGDFSAHGQLTAAPADPIHPLKNLYAVSSRMESLQRFLSDSISRNVLLGGHQMEMVSSAIQQVIANGTALLTLSQIPNPHPPNPNFQLQIPLKFPQLVPATTDSITVERKPEPLDEELDESDNKIDLDPDYEVIELDSVELLAEHVHFYEVCGKGFKRDANLRMHMRAHGEQFKRPEALAKPLTPAEDNANSAGVVGGRKHTRFSCPFAGCNRNQHHKKFRPLKSVICVRNHFKRSHCPKMYSCNRCNKKNFSVLADLKSHLKHCGQSKWRCTCGTTFSRKDKLFGHMALFEGHMPAIGGDDDGKGSKSSSAAVMEPEDDEMLASAGGSGGGVVDDGFFDDGLFGMDEKSIREMFGLSNSPDFVQQFYANM